MSVKIIFSKRDYVIVAELGLEILKNLRGIEIEFLQNNYLVLDPPLNLILIVVLFFWI